MNLGVDIMKEQDNYSAVKHTNQQTSLADDPLFYAHSYSIYEKLMERHHEIRGFLVQIRPIPEDVTMWVFGDGESWGKLIERHDVIKANRDAIEHVAHIFCEWLNHCASIEPQHELRPLARRFELRLIGSPASVFQLMNVMQRQSNSFLIQRIQAFCDAGGLA